MKFLPRSATLYYVDLGPQLSSYVWRAKRLKHVRKEGAKEKQTLKYCWWKKSYTKLGFFEPIVNEWDKLPKHQPQLVFAEFLTLNLEVNERICQ